MLMGRSHSGQLATAPAITVDQENEIRRAGLCVTVEVRSVYGTAKAYPVCARARSFAAIAGTATLTRITLRQIAAMGFEIISQANADWRGVA